MTTKAPKYCDRILGLEKDLDTPGMLEPQLERALIAHLEKCADCRANLEKWREIERQKFLQS